MIPSAVTLKQDAFLQFVDARVESEFLAYIHPRPLKAFVGAACFGFLLYAFLAITRSFTLMVPWFAVMLVCALVIQIGFRQTGKPHFLAMERWCWTLTVCAIATHSTQAFYNATTNSCSEVGEIPIDSRKAFREPNCQRWLNSLGVSTFVALSAIQIIPLMHIVAASVYYSVALAVIFVIVPPDSAAYNFGMYAAFIVPTLLFITFVRHEQEQVQRRLFLRFRELQAQRELLSAKERALAEFCSVILPKPVLWKLGQLNADTAVDATDSGVVLLCGVHNFGRWCTEQAPLSVCMAVVKLQSLARVVAGRSGMDCVGSVGDVTVCVANLIQPVIDASHRACRMGSSLLQESVSSSTTLPPLCVAINNGPLRGGFVGSLALRYVVFGDCYDAAGAALLDCPAGRAILGPGIRESVSGESSFRTLDHDDVNVNAPGIPTSPCGSEGSSSFSVHDLTSMDFSENLYIEVEAPNPNPISFLDMVQDALEVSTSSLKKGSGVEAVSVAGNDRYQQLSSADSAGSPSETPSLTNSNGLREKLHRYKSIRTVWCCFERFDDDELEEAFVSERIDALPLAGSRTWLAYAAYVAVILLLLLADFQGPRAIVGAIMLIVASLAAAVIGALPRLLSREQMNAMFFPWSAVGALLPLLVVYGCAVSRPSAVGSDPMLYPVLGALVRSYCFTSTRWQALVAFIATAIGFLQLLLPGGLTRGTAVLAPWIVVGVILIAEKQREAEHRANTRRKVELAVVLAELRKVERLRAGLLRTAVPAPIAKLVHRQVMMNVRDSTATQCDGAVLLVRAPTLERKEASLPTLGDLSSQFAALETLLAESKWLSLGTLMGDNAIVLGPVGLEPPMQDHINETLREVVDLGLALGEANPPFCAIADHDSVVHALVHEDFAQYWALGVTVTRLLAVMSATDATALRGFLVTDRVLVASKPLGLLDEVSKSTLGPMKFRGAGMLRFTRLRKTSSDEV